MMDAAEPGTASHAEFHPLTPELWSDLEQLFGARGACGGCWCMWWRLSAGEFEAGKGEANRKAFREIVRSGSAPGVLAFVDGRPAGWCAVAPRSELPRLERSRILKPVDPTPVWSITCFFVARAFRRRGLSVELLRAAVRFAGDRGASIVEGYPVEPREGDMPDTFAWHGTASAFRQAGFREVARRSATRPIMRYEARRR